ncbi:40S ribosomal protein S3a-like protein [Tanacetum coccineum]
MIRREIDHQGFERQDSAYGSSNFHVDLIRLNRKAHVYKKAPIGATLGGGGTNVSTTLWAPNQFGDWLATNKNSKNGLMRLVEMPPTSFPMEPPIARAQSRGVPFLKIMKDAGVLPGIRVDKGTVELDGTNGETIIEGLDGLDSMITVDTYMRGFIGADFQNHVPFRKPNTSIVVSFARQYASEGLKHRMFEISLAGLQNVEDHSYRKIRSRAEDVTGKNMLTNFWKWSGDDTGL